MPQSELDGGPDPSLDAAVVGDVLRRAARLGPYDAALTAIGPAGPRTWTAAALLHDAEVVATLLLRHGAAGAPVATLLTNGPAPVLLQLGAALAGAVLVPVNPKSTPGEVEHALRLSGAGRLFAEGDLADRAPRGIEVVALGDDLDALLGAGERADLPPVDPDALAQIQFTSGTSGRPKGVRIRHRGMVLTGHAFAGRIGLPVGGTWVNRCRCSTRSATSAGRNESARTTNTALTSHHHVRSTPPGNGGPRVRPTVRSVPPGQVARSRGDGRGLYGLRHGSPT